MVQALPFNTSFPSLLRYHQPQLLLNSEGKYYHNYKSSKLLQPLCYEAKFSKQLLPPLKKRSVLRKIKINENENRHNNSNSYTRTHHHPRYRMSSSSTKVLLPPAYNYCNGMMQLSCGCSESYFTSKRSDDPMMMQQQCKQRRHCGGGGGVKVVRFNDVYDEYIIPKRSTEELYQCWYNKYDYDKFHQERKDTVHMIQDLMVSYQFDNDYEMEEYLVNTIQHTTIYGVEQYIHGKEQICRRKYYMLQHIRTTLQKQKKNSVQRPKVVKTATITSTTTTTVDPNYYNYNYSEHYNTQPPVPNYCCQGNTTTTNTCCCCRYPPLTTTALQDSYYCKQQQYTTSSLSLPQQYYHQCSDSATLSSSTTMIMQQQYPFFPRQQQQALHVL